MKPLSLLATLLLSSVALAQAPAVTSVQPASGPSSGGTEVTITGANLLTKVQCLIPCPAHVVFGDISVPVKFESATRLVVDAPPHEPGTVDLTIAITAEQPLRLPEAFTYTADHDDAYEMFLLPVYLDGTVSGAFGSRWQTDFRLRAAARDGVQLAPWPCPPDLVCPPVFPLTTTVREGETIHNLPPFFKVPNGNPSRLLYASRPEVAMSLRVADVSRAGHNAGTDLPVIRESELRRGVTQLFNVPMNTGFRVLLRVYETAHTRATFVVRLYDQARLDSGAPAVHVERMTVATTQTNDFRTEAAYGALDVSDLLRLEKVWPAAVRIEIEPELPGSRYWAFASITSNETQLVTLSTPQ
ncbi:MAG TPA: IPT/TIG domain-containing protein [Thermoanaerobaculia bacterium]|nr:IPT/TIG domain-containing protein [Thermoanaerobaculia bacterium]